MTAALEGRPVPIVDNLSRDYHTKFNFIRLQQNTRDAKDSGVIVRNDGKDGVRHVQHHATF